jgi:RNA polymerase sigma factor (sigma-70 family)
MAKEEQNMSDSKPADSLPTRASLLSRLRDPECDRSWNDFFERYRSLIWRLARKAGLTDCEADEALQETMVCLARQLPEFRYDPAKGSFKGWLSTMVRRRVVDQMRKRKPGEILGTESLDRFVTSDALHDTGWEEEWENHLIAEAKERTRTAVSPLQYQMFDLFALQEVKMPDVKRLLNVSAPQVYMAKMRVGAIFRRELLAARKEADNPMMVRQGD